MEEVSCRIKRAGGKLVSLSIILDGECRVQLASLEGEFFADTEIDEFIHRLQGLQIGDALNTLRNALVATFVAPLKDLLECIDHLEEKAKNVCMRNR